jgi:hypothetical protein
MWAAYQDKRDASRGGFGRAAAEDREDIGDGQAARRI